MLVLFWIERDFNSKVDQVVKVPSFNGESKEEFEISINHMLESFIQEEQLGDEDMWYCSSCKTHVKVWIPNKMYYLVLFSLYFVYWLMYQNILTKWFLFKPSS